MQDDSMVIVYHFCFYSLDILIEKRCFSGVAGGQNIYVSAFSCHPQDTCKAQDHMTPLALKCLAPLNRLILRPTRSYFLTELLRSR